MEIIVDFKLQLVKFCSLVILYYSCYLKEIDCMLMFGTVWIILFFFLFFILQNSCWSILPTILRHKWPSHIPLIAILMQSMKNFCLPLNNVFIQNSFIQLLVDAHFKRIFFYQHIHSFKFYTFRSNISNLLI